MRVAAIIPARMGSSRFPGKPLAPILDFPMIQHVYQRTAASKIVNDVYVATCDEEIRKVVNEFGGNVIMTSASHQRASDRVAEASLSIAADIVVMVQGDEPMIIPEMIDDAVEPMLYDQTINCVNLVKAIETEQEYIDPNTIKVVMDNDNNAMYFSREPVPTRHISDFGSISTFKQVCIIPFRSEILSLYSHLEPTALEQAESVDMMRFLEHGYKVRMVPTDINSHAVDTLDDLKLVESLMEHDPLVQKLMRD